MPSPLQAPSLLFFEVFVLQGMAAVAQSLSCIWLFVTQWVATHQASLALTISWSLLKPLSIESVILSNQLILCHHLLLFPSVFPSITVFSNALALRIRWPKYGSFSFINSPPNEYSGLISFSIDWCIYSNFDRHWDCLWFRATTQIATMNNPIYISGACKHISIEHTYMCELPRTGTDGLQGLSIFVISW